MPSEQKSETSPKKIAANRRNAKLSTGPKTPEGKARSRLNALKHGLLAQDLILPDEDAEPFLELLEALDARLQPDDPLEQMLVHEIGAAYWRLRRLTRVETGLYWDRLDDTRERESSDEEQRTPEEQHDETTRLLGLAYLRDVRGADAFSRFLRYENTIRRGLYRALDRLQTLQRQRGSLPPPGGPQPASPQSITENDRTNPNQPTAPAPAPRPADRQPDAARQRPARGGDERVTPPACSPACWRPPHSGPAGITFSAVRSSLPI